MAPIELQGHEAMDAWNPTWRSGHVPAWLKRLIRARHKIENPGSSCYGREEDALYGYGGISSYGSALWDHWGSIKVGDVRHFITQPYNDISVIADMNTEATSLGCRVVECRLGAPWYKTAWYIELAPKIT